MAVKYTNNAKTTLASGLTNSATSATVADGSAFPSLGAGEYFYITFDDGSNNEIAKVTARSGNTLTIVRAQDNTSARAFSTGDSAELRVIAAVLTEIQENIAAKSANQTVYSATAASNATDYNIGVDPGVEANASVFLDGVYQHHDTFSFSGSTLTFDAAPTNGTKIEVVVDNLINLQSSNLTVDTFTATSGQTAFTLSDAPGGESNVLAFIDGVFQNQASFTLSSNTLTFDTGVVVGRSVTVYIINPVNIGTPSDNTVTSAKLSGNITLPGSLTVGAYDVAFDSPTFVVDNANSRVGIGTASPSTGVLDIVGDVTTSSHINIGGNLIKGSGDLTLDVAGDIYLDSDNANWRFNDAGTAILHISKPTGAVRLQSSVADADIIFGGIDGSTVIEALTLDMSNAGFATFNDGITLKKDLFINNADGSATAGYLYNDSNNFVVRSYTQDKDLIFKGNDGGSVITALTLDMSEAGKAIFNGQVTTPSIEVGEQAQPLSLLGTDHVYLGWYPISGQGRKAYAGFAAQNTTTFTLNNESSGGNMLLTTGGSTTIDAAGEIILSADDNGEIVLKDGSLHYGTLLEDNSNFILRSAINDEDIIFQGYDNGGLFTALTLDMSEAGDAYFNRRISVGGVITNTSANADDIVLGSYNDATERGITFASTTGGGIRWNDAADAGVIQYSHSSNEMYYSSTSHHRFVATTANAAGTVRVNVADAGSGVVSIHAADVTENGVGALELRSPNSAMRLGGTDGRSWIQTHSSQPLYVNKLGNNVIFNADGAGAVGIGVESPDNTLHIHKGSAGTVNGNTNAPLTVENSTANYIQMLAPNAQESGILFGNPANSADSGIIHSDADDTLAFRVGSNSTKVIFTATGNIVAQSETQNRIVLGSTGNSSNNTSNWMRGNAGYLQFNSASSGYNWEINGANKMAMDSAGILTLTATEFRVNNSATYPLRAASSGTVLRGASVHHVIVHDHRTPKQSSAPHGHMSFGFTSYGLNNSSPWADILYLQSYTDASGGSPNAIVVSRSGSNAKIVRYPWSNSSTTAISGGTQYGLDSAAASDERLKENVNDITNGLTVINKLRPVTFNWNDTYIESGSSKNASELKVKSKTDQSIKMPSTKVENVGLIAQEVEKVVPTVVHEGQISIGGVDYKNVDYKKLVPHLIAALQEADAKIEALTTRIEALE